MFVYSPVLQKKLCTLPLAVCHVHLEAAVSEYQQIKFAEYKEKKLPTQAFPSTYRYDEDDWASFANPYFGLCKLIDDPKDFYILTKWVLETYKKQNVVFVELIFSPDLAQDNCAVVIDWREMLLHAQRAMTEAEADGTIKVSGVVTFLRDASQKKQGQKALENVQFVIDNKNELQNFRGFHLAGDEDSFPDAQEFADAYKLARDNGYGCAVHAGETGKPEHIWNALEWTNPHRIGHGIATIHDPLLIEELKKRNIPLEVCVTSNLCMDNVTSLQEHPLPDLMKAGVTCLYGNPDDDRLFDTSPMQEMITLMNVFGFTQDDIIENTCRIITHGFLPEDQKRDLLDAITEKS